MSNALECFNRMVTSGLFKLPLQFFSRSSKKFSSVLFLQDLCYKNNYLDVKIGDMANAARIAGAEFDIGKVDLQDLQAIEMPILAYLKDSKGEKLGLVFVKSFNGQELVFEAIHGLNAVVNIDAARIMWSGICIFAKDLSNTSDELMHYNEKICVIDSVVSPNECSDLVDLCEASIFQRSKVVDTNSEGGGIVEKKVRSSSSAILSNRTHPILRRMYRSIADAENVNERSIETIQAVRYRKWQRFTAHYDGGIKLPRLKTYLLYLNDNFNGGETVFPILNRAIVPRAGSCLKFPSCSPDGRILWPSEHGGSSVTDGVKYALNIWVRCPA